MSIQSAAKTREANQLGTKQKPASFTPELKNAETKLTSLLADIQRDEMGFVPGAGRRQGERRDIATMLRWFLASDAFALFLGFVCAWGVAIVTNQFFLGRAISGTLAEGDPLRFGQFLMISAGVLLWFEHTGHYRVRMPFWLETKKIFCVLSFAMAVDGFLEFASKQDPSRLWLVASWLFAAIAIVALRVMYRSALLRQGRWQIPTLLVGSGATAEDARAALQSEPGLGYDIVAQVKDLPQMFQRAGDSWEELCAMYGTDYVVIALDGADLAKAELSLAQLTRENVPFSVSPPLRHIPVFGMVPHYFFNHDVMLMTRSSGLEQPMPRFIKRTFDVVVAGAAFLLVSPLMLAIALSVKLDGGPALFGQKRPGLNGKLFTCFKFRSMVPEADEALERFLAENADANAEYKKFRKLRKDPRVTHVGALLRRYSLDELPQLINVLRGDMSLVGPRPILVSERSLYSHDIAHYYRVRPGITGLWQVSGRSNVSFPKRVQMESWYVRNWSLWHDIAIICKTVPVLFKRTGAY